MRVAVALRNTAEGVIVRTDDGDEVCVTYLSLAAVHPAPATECQADCCRKARRQARAARIVP